MRRPDEKDSLCSLDRATLEAPYDALSVQFEETHRFVVPYRPSGQNAHADHSEPARRPAGRIS
jgi:hypothetical protein